MGYCYNNEAGRVLDVVDKAMRDANPNGCSNEWRDERGARYFYEVARKDQPDGGIRGSIHRFEGESNMARRVGHFQITGDGRVMRAPKFWLDAIERHGRNNLNARAIGARMAAW